MQNHNIKFDIFLLVIEGCQARELLDFLRIPGDEATKRPTEFVVFGKQVAFVSLLFSH